MPSKVSDTDLDDIRIKSSNVKNYDIHSPVVGAAFDKYLPLTYTTAMNYGGLQDVTNRINLLTVLHNAGAKVNAVDP
eukprot:Pgem_evm1s15681